MNTLPTTRLTNRLAKGAIAAAVALSALLPGLAYADQPPPPVVPPAIRAPAGHVPFLLGRATGTQNYTCQPTATGYGWTFVAPSATLVDKKGKQIITHFAGPTWQARDGSTVVGAVVARVDSPSGAIPWLLLRATSTTLGPDGGDRLTRTTYIQRVNTTGGLAPTSGCGPGAEGAVAKVPYTSDYYFYRAKPGGSA
jgi:hypothetical protein